MNLNGMKKLLRNERQQLMVKVYEAVTGELLYSASIGEFREKGSPYDRSEVMWVFANFDMDGEYEWEEDVIAGFEVSIAIEPEMLCQQDDITMQELSGLFECQWRMTYNQGMCEHFRFRLRHLSQYSQREQEEILARLQAYGELKADYIKLHFDVDEMYSFWVDAQDGLEADDDYDELMSVDLYPVLPEGMDGFE
ncbi:MAG: hypothetical protein IJ315_08290 [Firmicutes bacterium]|nr:hypothetical protein [Bacillota bacterium]